MLEIRDIISIVCLCIGLFFCLTTTIGLYRLPDFYSRCHTAGNSDRFFKGLALRFHEKTEGKAFCQAGYQKPVTAHGKAVGNREADPGILDNLQIQSAMVTGNVIDAHEKHHEKTHHYGKNQTFSLILRHIFPPVPAAKKRALSVTFATDNTRCQFTTICI